MKVLFVNSDNDYGALTFEQTIDEENYLKIWKASKEFGDTVYINSITQEIFTDWGEALRSGGSSDPEPTFEDENLDDDFDEDDDDDFSGADAYVINAKAYEFGYVDPNFLEFIRDQIQDEDNAKHFSFFVVEE